MAIVNNFWLKGQKKKLGGAVIYQAGGETRSRALAEAVSNPRTRSQMKQRVRWSNLVNFYKVNAEWMKYAYETKKSNQSEYNKLMSLNVASSPIYLTKQQAAAGACVVANYIMTQGSLPSITYTEANNYIATNLYISGDTQFNEDSTLGEVAADLLASNPALRQGDQISFLRFTQLVNEVTGYPYVVLRKYEVLLDPTSNDKFYNYMPFGIFSFDSTAETPAVVITKTGNSGGCLLVLSRTIAGKTYVSTQSILPVDNGAIIAAYSSNQQLEAAIDSYGSSEDAFLTTDRAGYAENEIIQLVPLSISVDGVVYTPNEYYGAIGVMNQKRLEINFNRNFNEDVEVVYIDTNAQSGGTATEENPQVSGQKVIISNVSAAGVPSTAIVRGIRVVTNDYTYDFKLSTAKPDLE